MPIISGTRLDTGKPYATRQAAEGHGRSESRSVVELADVSIRLGTWIAEPGTYKSPGVPVGEWFVVISGSGNLVADGSGESVRLEPGVIAWTQANCPSTLWVEEKLSKVALVGTTTK